MNVELAHLKRDQKPGNLDQQGSEFRTRHPDNTMIYHGGIGTKKNLELARFKRAL